MEEWTFPDGLWSSVKHSARASTTSPTDIPSRQRVVVMVGLMGSLALVSLVLLVWAPAPLRRQTPASLLATETVDGVFTTDAPLSKQWKAIYLHHSFGDSGDGRTLAIDENGPGDHFIIGNGAGTADGEILLTQRWMSQQPALPGGRPTPSGYISICLVGNFDEDAPTSLQMRRLDELLKALRLRLGIPRTQIQAQDDPGSPVGIGRFFPRAALVSQLTP
jgi:hypothetical protein